MKRIIQFFKNLWTRFFGKKPVLEVQHATIPAPKPIEMPKRVTIKHPLGIGHSMTRLKHIGGHPVRHLGREFKETFYHDYGVRLK